MKKTIGHLSAVQVAIACVIVSGHSPKAYETNNAKLIFNACEPDDITQRDMTLILFRLSYRYLVVGCPILASPTSLFVQYKDPCDRGSVGSSMQAESGA